MCVFEACIDKGIKLPITEVASVNILAKVITVGIIIVIQKYKQRCSRLQKADSIDTMLYYLKAT